MYVGCIEDVFRGVCLVYLSVCMVCIYRYNGCICTVYIGCLEVYIQMYIWCVYTCITGAYRCIYGNNGVYKECDNGGSMMLTRDAQFFSSTHFSTYE